MSRQNHFELEHFPKTGFCKDFEKGSSYSSIGNFLCVMTNPKKGHDGKSPTKSLPLSVMVGHCSSNIHNESEIIKFYGVYRRTAVDLQITKCNCKFGRFCVRLNRRSCCVKLE